MKIGARFIETVIIIIYTGDGTVVAKPTGASHISSQSGSFGKEVIRLKGITISTVKVLENAWL